MKKKLQRSLMLILAMGLALGCTHDNEFVAPGFLEIESVDLVKSPSDPFTQFDCLYTSDIVGLYISGKRPGAMKFDTIGLYRLPLCVPVLFDGVYDYIELSPAIKQSGSTNALPYYTYYKTIRIDSVAIHSGDTTRLGKLHTTYDSHAQFLMKEDFELGNAELDSTVRNITDATLARTGVGFGRVEVADSVSRVDFNINKRFTVNDETSVLYLELDIRSDIELQVLMYAPTISGGTDERLSVMTIYPTDGEWSHLYINLGRTWSYTSHSKTFKLGFSIVNLREKGGVVDLDNVRLMCTSRSI